MRFLGGLVSLGGVFQCLPGILLPSLVISFAMMCCGNAMRVRCEVMEFCGSLVRVLGHRWISWMI
jgi:hypothetical protein